VSTAADPRLGPIDWPMPDQRQARRRAMLMALICTGLAVWYLSWLLGGAHVGNPVLFGMLIAAETFNLVQAVGFWWTCSHQRMREGRAPTGNEAVDVMIPVYDEPVDVVEPTVAGAAALHGAEVRVWLLDDGRRVEMRALADRHGVGYLTREDNVGAKAGNLNSALRHTSAPYVAVLDCDHVPRPQFLQRTLGHLEDFGVAFVQTPQYYANASSGPIASAAAAQQNLFFGPIARGKDGLDSIFCCGTNVIFRRTALEEVGGFSEESVTEDFELSVRLHEAGWRSVYVPEVLACGLGPEDMASYVSQQQRWARGCLGAIPRVLRSRLPWRARLQYLLSATYFLTGATLLIYMSLPVIRILTGAQPLAAATADQFLLHFAPYYCGALATVALAGYGMYTYEAFALAAGSFWIHVQAAFNSLLRRPARFVVTPKHGTVERQPRAVVPALLAIAILIGTAIYGLSQNHGAATLNNVAFASLHACVLLTAVIPALRLRPSAPLLPDPPAAPPRSASTATRVPRPIAATVIAAAVMIPVGLGLVGARGLASHPTLSQKAHDSAQSFFDRYVQSDGRVVRTDQGGDTVSEGQAYATLLAVALDDRASFDRVWGWTRNNLQQSDGLLAYHWANGHVDGTQPATDADLDAARALVLAGRRFGSDAYESDGERIGEAVLAQETSQVSGVSVLVAGPWARSSSPVVNPSYFSPRAYADLASAHHDSRWDDVAATSRSIESALTKNGTSLPPDWAHVSSLSPSANGEATAQAEPIAAPPGGAPSSVSGSNPASGLDAVRVAIRSAESCIPADRRVAARLWPLYRSHPGALTYSLNGTPLTSQTHAASFVAAAAAAKAAGQEDQASQLLDRAQAADAATPTYYGAAWVALGRVLLTSSALGSCPS
jgi:cellulose synthase (UDP-forming)